MSRSLRCDICSVSSSLIMELGSCHSCLRGEVGGMRSQICFFRWMLSVCIILRDHVGAVEARGH